ncbi:MAG: hypothetical protein JWM87_3709 [Candidatus Eremiobacteraeota bacterium]|nr:hypothetical protein [Candidatus Eremiobacteraeota bacterium]
MTLQLGILFAAAMMAGGMNALAGGGTFFSFPALMALGVPPLLSNATNALSVTPGHALAAVVYKREIARAPRRVIMCSIAAGAGAIIGAWLLTVTNAKTFNALVPWLLLVATLMFAFGPAVQKWTKRLTAATQQPVVVTAPNAVGNNLKSWIGYALASVYGGYFGAGQGIVLMTVVTLSGVEDPQEANAIKNAVATFVSFIAILVLASRGLILWNYGVLMVGGALIGGFAGGKLAKVLSKRVLRNVILVVAVFLTVVYFWRQYAH